MCFSIPVKVLSVEGNTATVEGGKKVRFDKSLKINNGDFVRLTGDIIVDKLTKENGLKVRRLIKRLNS